MQILILIVLLLLTACQTTAVQQPAQEIGVPEEQFNSILHKAKLNVALVMETGSEWVIQDESTYNFIYSSQPLMGESAPNRKISLQRLLYFAQIHFDVKNFEEGERLSSLISAISKLALSQHSANKSNQPVYPQSE